MTFKKLRVWLATLAAVCCLIPASFARGTASSPPPRHRASRKSRKSKSRKSASRRSTNHGKSSRSRSRRRRPSSSSRSSFHQRFSKLHPEPGRVDQIQEALIGAGDLHEEPTGTWDPATRAAMSRYQAANGFPVTGKPDAKSLMKLGLGPHPLPDSLARNGADSTPGASSGTSSDSASTDKSESAPPE